MRASASGGALPKRHSRVGGLHVLRLAEIFAGRGDAHAEMAWNPWAHGHSQRDCLHMCVAPGMSDALALATAAAIGG
eukprot:1694459-Prymnesium_polylepis.1